MRTWRICVLAAIVVTVATAALAVSLPSVQAVATAPPTTAPAGPGPVATNDLLPSNNNLGNCIGTAESANCGSRNRADGHTYLVFLALIAGLGFIGWRIARGVRARDAAKDSAP